MGLVFALFNKLYMGTKIMAALKLIFLSITTGLVVGIGLLLWTGMGTMACTATLVCGWMYGLGSWRYIHYRDDSNVHKWGVCLFFFSFIFVGVVFCSTSIHEL